MSTTHPHSTTSATAIVANPECGDHVMYLDGALVGFARTVHEAQTIPNQLAVLSTGETIANPRWYRTQTRKLRRAQQALSRKLKGSRNREKARIVVARLHQKIGNQRKDFLHKLSTDLIQHNDLVSIEDLNVRGLAKTKLACDVRLSTYLFCSATLPRQNLLSHQQYPWAAKR